MKLGALFYMRNQFAVRETIPYTIVAVFKYRHNKSASLAMLNPKN